MTRTSGDKEGGGMEGIINDICVLRHERIKKRQDPTKIYAGHKQYYAIMLECAKMLSVPGPPGSTEFMGMRLFRVLEEDHLDVV